MDDPRLGRFFAIDPLFREFPWNSTYAFAENSVIAFIELEGLETVYFNGVKNDPIDFTTMTDEQIEAALESVYSGHQGNITLESVKSASPKSVWIVNNINNTFMRSVGTLVIGFDSKQDFVDGKIASETVIRDISQTLFSLDDGLEGEQGLIKANKGFNAVGTSLLLTPAAPIGEGILIFSTIIDIGLDFKNKSTEQATINTGIRLLTFGVGKKLEKIIPKEVREINNRTVDFGVSMGLDGLQNQFILNIESSNENTETTKSTQTPKQ